MNQQNQPIQKGIIATSFMGLRNLSEKDMLKILENNLISNY